MRRIWLDLFSFAAALALASALLIRWRNGQVAMVSNTAAPAIRLLALLIVFLQGCADKLRGREEPDGHGAVPGVAGQPASGAGQGGPGDSQDGAEDMSQATGSERPGPEDMVKGPPLDAAFPLRSQAELIRCLQVLSDQGWRVSAYKRMTRRLATVPEGAPATDPAWQELLDGLAGVGAAGRFSTPDDQARGAAFEAQWRAHLEGRGDGKAASLAELQALLVAAEALPLFDAWLAAYVWRRGMAAPADTPARAEFLARVERHLRVRHALLKGQVEAGPVEFTAWRSKAAPPRDWVGVEVPPGLLEAAQRAYATTDAGTWETAGTLTLAVRGEGVALLRRGQVTPLKVGQTVALRRLDLLQANRPAILRHDELGDMSLGSGATMSAWDAGERLSAEGKARVRELVAAAQKGDEAALKRLEALLPAAHAEMRAAVAAAPAGARGSAGLSMLLALFDE